MKISEVKAHNLVAPLKEPWKISGSVFAEMRSTIVEVTTDEGVTGYGECLTRMGGEAMQAIVHTILKPVLVGQDLWDVDMLWEQMFATMKTKGHAKGFMIEAISGVDIALWDALGKSVGQPVSKLLGGTYRTRVQPYASSLLFKDTQVLVEEAKGLVAQGFCGVKLKVGQGLEIDVRNVRAIRDAIGDEVGLYLDANSAFDPATAIVLGKGVEPYNVGWFEEPVAPWDYPGYARVVRALPIPIAGGESEFTRYGFRDLILAGQVGVIQPDICRAGGFTECMKIAALASTFSVPYAPHTGASGAISIAASLQLSAALANFLIFEFMYPPNPLREELLKEPLEVKKGWMDIPDKPGLGVEIDPDKLKDFIRT